MGELIHRGPTTTTGIIMTAWLLLISLFCLSAQSTSGLENDILYCGPQNVALSTSDQTLLLTWEDKPSCLALKDVLTYELLVLIADKQEHYDEIVVTHDQIGSTHSWNWTSYLALECAAHSVRLRSRYNNQTSPWKQEKALPGNRSPKKWQVYPRDRVFEAGSTATFCCIVPAGESFNNTYLSDYNGLNKSITKISNQTYALTLNLNEASDRCIDVKCRTSRTTYGACVFVGYPPGDSDLQCETRDLKSVECHWTVGRDTQLSLGSPTRYKLQGRDCAEEITGSCSHLMPDEAGETNWTLTARNQLGEVRLHDRADLTTRVRMFAPEQVTASTVNSRNVSLEWRWTVDGYNQLSLTCEVRVSHGDTSSTSETSGVGLNAAVLTDLIPNWTYNVTVRCRTAQHWWKWGDWSKASEFHTKGDVPDALDVWMQAKENQVVVVWKTLLANQSHGQITEYEVTWATNKTRVAPSERKLMFCLDTSKEHDITVTAWNVNGSSSPSAITTPSISPDRTRVNTSWITGSNGGFMLSWASSPEASCGYIVDWCPTLDCDAVEWIKVPANNTNATIFSKDFKDGLRYSLSIYACTEGAPVLLERREGYVRETIIEEKLFESLKFEQQKTDVEISWAPIPLRRQTVFIRGYTLYYWNQDGDGVVFNVSTDDPEATSLTARNLKIASYKFTVAARTALGECGNTSIDTTLNSLTDDLFKTFFVALGLVSGLLIVTTVLCYRHWACIKNKVYPPIPKPVLMDNWLTPAGELTCQRLHLDLQSEADTMNVPELHRKPGVPVNDYVGENVPFSFTQTPKGYYNKPLTKDKPPPLILPSTDAPPPPGLPSSLLRGVFPNPSYNLVPGDHLSSCVPKVQEGTPVMETSDGYQPQNQPFPLSLTAERPDSPMSCGSAYILVP
ncbi:leukemia inhibitory factor receptor-like [Stegastes partitus]|uniref:Leukemia inhibitory factor receptor-like n=1 Tax=Stegastes partitus TaxID=144197 RepID=A0A3B5BC49_9TELE|nr:PREDICTED: leukemia inhibitory factor receptor-like [Stegastes partitus]